MFISSLISLLAASPLVRIAEQATSTPQPLQQVAQQKVQQATQQATTFVDRLEHLGRQILPPSIKILVIIIVAFICFRLLRRVVRGTITHILEHDASRREVRLRANTLANVVESVARIIILIIAIMMILSAIGFNIVPLLASAGVVGIAIGLGAQTLIKDFIGGFFIFFEDQFGIGDVVTIGSATGPSGLVEFMSLRRTGLRAGDGSYIIVPNGDIRTVFNMTKGWSRAVVDISIPSTEDPDPVIARLKADLAKFPDDPKVGKWITGPPDVIGIETLTDSLITIRILVTTKPADQWAVQRELRLRVWHIVNSLTTSSNGTEPPNSVTVYQPEEPADQQQQSDQANTPAGKPPSEDSPAR